MKTGVNLKRIIAVISAFMMILTLFSSVSAETYTYRTLTYFAGDVDNLVGASEVNFQKIINTTFDAAASSRFSRNGYHLKSWYVPSTGETVGTGSQYTMPDHDITFVANWVPETYKITFTGKGGKTAEGSANFYVNAEYGTTIIMPENSFIYSGYQFEGWKYNGITYKTGDVFEVPAILSGAKIVISAVWSKSSNIITTKPVTTTTAQRTESTVTTTEFKMTTSTTSAITEVTSAEFKQTTKATETTVTSTDYLSNTSNTTTDVSINNSGGTLTKIFELNAELDFNNNDKKMYNIQMNDILDEGIIEKLEINLSSKNGNINNFIIGIGTLIDDSWYQVDYNENIQSNEYTINFADSEICSKLSGSSIQIGYWWGNTTPLYIDSVTVTYKTTASDEINSVTLMPETTSFQDNDIISTKEVTTSCVETTTVTENLTTELTTSKQEVTDEKPVVTSLVEVTTVEISHQTSGATTLKDSQYSKIVNLNSEIENNSTLTIKASDLISVNQIIESIQLNFTSDGDLINSYSIGVDISKADSSWEQIAFNDICDCSQLIIGKEISEKAQDMITKDSYFNISYRQGDCDSLNLESITINYRIDSGDYDNDGEITLDDAEALKKYLVGISTPGFEIDNNTADLNCDGKINVFDYMYLYRLLN